MFRIFLHLKVGFVRIRQAGDIRRTLHSRMYTPCGLFSAARSGAVYRHFASRVLCSRGIPSINGIDLCRSEASSEVDGRIRFPLRHNLLLFPVAEGTVIRIIHDLRRLFHAENLPCRLFSHTEEKRVFTNMNVACFITGISSGTAFLL